MDNNMNSSKEIFKYFVGSWDVNRIVGSMGIAQGVAKFVLKDNNSILFREDLKVKYNHSTKPEIAYKEYIYVYNQDTKRIIKKFSDNRLFYEISHDFSGRKAYGEHLCECDNYKATYEFLNQDCFTLSYDVRGPQKDYVIETKFTRIKGDSKESLRDEL